MISTQRTGENTPGQAEDALLRSIAQGDRDALRQLYIAAAPRLFGYALSILRSRPEAEDILQDTFLKIGEKAGSYTSQGKPIAWMLAITRNLCYMRLRSQKGSLSLEEDPLANLPAPSQLEFLESRLVLKGALLALGLMERQIVLLHAVCGFKHREIASFLGLPLSTVLSKYSRSLKKLRAYLKEENHG